MSDMDWSELERAAGAGTIRSLDPSLGTLWFSMRGRIPRSTYWLKFFVPMMGLQILAAVVDAWMGTLPANGGFGPFATVVCLALLYPGLVGAVKRLHDLAHPGWYIAVYYGGMVGMGVALAVAVPLFGEAALVLLIPGIILMLGSMWFALKMAFVRGTPGTNRYGRESA
jgi:uncharacterized membrane protein YhaH (DUF805 family)